MAIIADPPFEQTYVFGDERPFIACVVVLNRMRWMRLATELQLDAAARESLEAPVARGAALKRISTLVRAFPYCAQPRRGARARALERRERIDDAYLKLKRPNLAAHFVASIEAMYLSKAPTR